MPLPEVISLWKLFDPGWSSVIHSNAPAVSCFWPETKYCFGDACWHVSCLYPAEIIAWESPTIWIIEAERNCGWCYVYGSGKARSLDVGNVREVTLLQRITALQPSQRIPSHDPIIDPKSGIPHDCVLAFHREMPSCYFLSLHHTGTKYSWRPSRAFPIQFHCVTLLYPARLILG